MTRPAESISTPEDAGRRVRAALQALMGAQHVTAADMARRLGKQPQWLYDRLTGGVRLSVEETAAIADELGSSLGEIVALAEDPRLTRGLHYEHR